MEASTLLWDGAETNYTQVPTNSELNLTEGAAYCHYTSNETIHGVQFPEPPEVGEAPLVVDQSSDFLSEPLDIKRFGMIYACAQKNCGIAGVTTLIIRRELLERAGDRLPRYLDYAQHVKGASMLNTPPTFAIYVTGLVCNWIQNTVGGLEEMHRLNQEKANLLYNLIDNSGGFFLGHAQPSRPLVNECRFPFRIARAGFQICYRSCRTGNDRFERPSQCGWHSSFHL